MKRYSYNWETEDWDEFIIPALSEMGIFVLNYSVMGFTLEEISEWMCKSIQTIKGYRTSNFAELGVNNITETVNFALLHHLI